MTSADSLSLILRRLDEIERKLDRMMEELRTPLPSAYSVRLRHLKHEQAETLLRLGVRQSGETRVCCREDGDPKRPGSVTGEFARLQAR
jgi:hypothetical protein